MRSDTWPDLRRRAGTPLAALLWLVAAIAAAWLCWGVLMPAASQSSFGFASYYTSARLVLAGRLGPQIYENPWFQTQERRLGVRDDIYGTQPPTMAMLMAPVAWMPPAAARYTWLIFDMIWLLGVGIISLALAYGTGVVVSPASVAAMVILVAIYRPLHAELHYAQVYTMLALIYAVWLYGYVTGRDWLCGMALAALALAKLAGAPLWIVLIATRRWRALAWSVGLTVAGLVGTLPLVGLETWRAYLFGRVGDLATGGLFGVTALQTIISLLRQLFVFDVQYTPAPLIDAPWLAVAFWLTSAAALIWLTVARARPAQNLLTGAAAICLVVPLQPAGEQHHYVIILAPLLLALLLAGQMARRAPAALALLGLALALLLVPAYFLDNAAWAGWPRALLAYPRLYGALALWGALLALRAASRTTEAFAPVDDQALADPPGRMLRPREDSL